MQELGMETRFWAKSIIVILKIIFSNVRNNPNWIVGKEQRKSEKLNALVVYTKRYLGGLFVKP